MPYERKADRIMKRFFALLLCMLMCMSLLPGTAFAEGYRISVVNGTATVNGETVAVAESGEAVTVTANTQNGKIFTGWTSTPEGLVTGTVNPATFTMPEGEVTVTAAFADEIVPVKYRITVNSGSATVDGEAATEAESGDTVTVTANTQNGKVFTGWTSDPSVTFSDATASSTTFAMPNNNVAVTANFEEEVTTTHNITVNDGTASLSNAQAGTTVEVTAIVPEGQVFSGWTSNPSVAFEDASATSTTFSMPNEDVTVTATFRNAATTFGVASRGTEVKSGSDAGLFTVTVEGGTANPSSAAPGKKVTITAEGEHFLKWTTEDDEVLLDKPNETSASFIMPSHNVTVKANYAEEKYIITVNNGTSTPATEATPGTRVDITAGTLESMIFKEWTSDQTGSVTFKDVASPNTFFIMPDHNVSITATFVNVSNAHKITVTNGTSIPRDKAAEGVTVTVTANIPNGKVFKTWTSNPQSVKFADATASQTTFRMLGEDVSITAEFAEEYSVEFDTVLPAGITIKNAPEPQHVLPNGKATKPTDPSDSAQHHKFVGWYKSDGTPFSFDTPITSNITLYAKWKHPYDEGICYYCWKAQPDYIDVEQPGFSPDITRGIIGKPPSTAHYGSSHSFVMNTCFPYVEKSVCVYVDGKPIKLNDQYKLSEGSTIVTLRPWYIKSLTPGEHTIRIDTNLGTARGSFRVSSSPKTGDDSNVALWVTVGVISAAGATGIAYYLLKKRRR